MALGSEKKPSKSAHGGAFTAKTFTVKDAPKKMTLLGDKKGKPESAQHIIEFPGGAIELSRHSDGVHYWAHIIVNQDHGCGDGNGRTSALGKVVASRIDTQHSVREIEAEETITQIAVMIRPYRDPRS